MNKIVCYTNTWLQFNFSPKNAKVRFFWLTLYKIKKSMELILHSALLSSENREEVFTDHVHWLCFQIKQKKNVQLPDYRKFSPRDCNIFRLIHKNDKPTLAQKNSTKNVVRKVHNNKRWICRNDTQNDFLIHPQKCFTAYLNRAIFPK
jgi:hypothetical protein